jgi:general secretion pathway protein G
MEVRTRMHNFFENAISERGKRGFTLVELLVVIVILAVLAAIVLPKFMDSGKRSKEAALKGDLKLLRNAVTLFQTDTGAYPLTLADLAATSAPAKGLDTNGAQQDIPASTWHGPYVQEIPNDPISSGSFSYTVSSPNVGKVKSNASGNAIDGTAFSSW